MKRREDMYRQKYEALKIRIEWAMRADKAGMVGFVCPLLRGEMKLLDTEILGDMTLRQFIEAVEEEDE